MSLLDIIYNHFQKKKNSVQKKDSEESTYYFTPYTEVDRKQYIEEPMPGDVVDTEFTVVNGGKPIDVIMRILYKINCVAEITDKNF